MAKVEISTFMLLLRQLYAIIYICCFEGVAKMSVSYKKLWHILLDRDMKKKDLAAMAGLTPYMMKKLTRDEPVTTEVIGKICTSLSCRADDILEFCND